MLTEGRFFFETEAEAEGDAEGVEVGTAIPAGVKEEETEEFVDDADDDDDDDDDGWLLKTSIAPLTASSSISFARFTAFSTAFSLIASLLCLSSSSTLRASTSFACCCSSLSLAASASGFATLRACGSNQADSTPGLLTCTDTGDVSTCADPNVDDDDDDEEEEEGEDGCVVLGKRDNAAVTAARSS